MADDPNDTSDAGRELRKLAANSLRKLMGKQEQASASLVTAFTAHARASQQLVIKMAETGDVHVKEWVGNAVALSIETWSAAYNACTEAGAPAAGATGTGAGSTAPSKQPVPVGSKLELSADDTAEIAGPRALAVKASDVATLDITPLLDANGNKAGHPAKLDLSTNDGAVFVEIQDLIDENKNPLPLGKYTAKVVKKQTGATVVDVSLERKK